MTPENSEPFGRHRWNPLVDVEQPLMIKGAATSTEDRDTDQPSLPEPADLRH